MNTDDETIIHVSVVDGTEEQLRGLREFFEDALADYAGHGQIVLTDDRVDIQEYPALDTYADELADRVADRVLEARDDE